MQRTNPVVIFGTALVFALSGLNIDTQDTTGNLVEWPHVGAEQSHTNHPNCNWCLA